VKVFGLDILFFKVIKTINLLLDCTLTTGNSLVTEHYECHKYGK